jgi:IclR family KDG regulon transcriptional repressor
MRIIGNSPRKAATGGVRPLSSVLKTLSLLDVLAEFDASQKLSAIATQAKMSPATAHQKLLTLIQAGWVERTEDSTYRLSLHANRVGTRAMEQAGLGDRLMPFLERLTAKADHSSSLAVFEGLRASVIQRIESSSLVRAQLYIGVSLHLAESASGRVLTAFASKEMRARLRESNLRLADDRVLERVQRDHFSTSSGRSWVGISAAAVPIFNAAKRCIAALALVGPSPHFSLEKAKRDLKQAAAEINAFLASKK